MIGKTEEDVLEELAFANKAAKCFAEHKEINSFGHLAPGSFLALRWGLGDDCVLILKIDEDFGITNYHQLIRKYQSEEPTP